MTLVKYLTFGFAMLACAALPSNAQTQKGSAAKTAACRSSVRAAWYTKQQAWLDDSKHTWTNDTLRQQLLQSAGLSASGALPVQVGWLPPLEAHTAGDSAMIASLRATAATRGAIWPTKSVVGAAATRAVWHLSLRDTALARATLKRMMEAGPDESNSADVATLEDRVRLASGRKQIYGTQFVRDGNTWRLDALEDSAHVDLRREDAGLPPLAYSLCLAKAARE